MIKINRDFDELSKTHREKILPVFDIKAKLMAKINNTINQEKRFYQYLHTNINDILEKDIEHIQTVSIPAIDVILGVNFFNQRDPTDRRKKINKDKIDEVNEIFDYSSFSEFKPAIYNAYDLLEELKINVCPYCNRQYVNTVKPINSVGGTRPTLDHYLLKSHYPYLGLSFWNLVPSCYSCNSQLRTSREIGLHPYKKGFDEILHFYTDITDITQFIGNSKKYFSLSLTKYKNKTPDIYDYTNAEKNNVVFRLNDIYQNHKDYVREIIQKAIVYDKFYSKDLYKEFSDIFENEEEAKNMMLSNYTETESFEKRPLAKLTRDIAIELEII